MVAQCWATVADVVLALRQHCLNVWCLLGVTPGETISDANAEKCHESQQITQQTRDVGAMLV